MSERYCSDESQSMFIVARKRRVISCCLKISRDRLSCCHCYPRGRKSQGFGFFTAVCLFFRTISQKPLQLALPNVTWKCSTVPRWDLEIHLFWGQKVKITSQKTQPAWVFALLWVLASSGFYSRRLCSVVFVHAGAVVCVAMLNRFVDDQVRVSRDTQHTWEQRPSVLVSRLISKRLTDVC